MAIEKQKLMLMLRRMWLIRHFEETVIKVYTSGEFGGAAHPYIGEEAVAVGACVALRDSDYIAGNHRSHGHPIAKGGDVKKAMAEIYGRRDGYCKGKGGSMHLADFSIGILGESGIVASSVPVATGAALAAKLQKKDFVSAVFFGDGASNQGACHEAMNLGSVWKLPVIFICENNQYAVTTPYKSTVSSEHIADRAQAYNMPGVLVDGQDAIAMYEATTEAVKRARAGRGPTLIEALTYRFEEHSLGLGRIRRSEYRTAEEVTDWRKRDPIVIHEKKLLETKTATQAEIDAIKAETGKEVDAALEFARQSPFPEAAELYEDMWADKAMPIP
ncbi:MAG: thiamine pyrophosphate-dependent dehydrogenase E1 component subunit alpha [SAR202 cluster bacterium]|nr:thiamine pyrophosphate-dependent dehydrogenase E1 component subunit alpha [SAR202 cluster bacterium]